MKGTTVLPADVIGINFYTSNNSLMYAGKRVSWVKDNNKDIQNSWGGNYRDIIFLDGNNKPLVDENNQRVVFNVDPPRSLENQTHRAAVKALLIRAATPVDSDNDKLPDFWEINTFGNLSRHGASPEPSGLSVLQHYATGAPSGSAPPAGLPRIVSLLDGTVSVMFTRRRGTAFGLTVLPEFSRTLSGWEADGHGWEEWSVRTQYDGTCTEIVEWKILAPGDWRFVRIKSTLP